MTIYNNTGLKDNRGLSAGMSVTVQHLIEKCFIPLEVSGFVWTCNETVLQESHVTAGQILSERQC